jgi:hypothetical protein
MKRKCSWLLALLAVALWAAGCAGPEPKKPNASPPPGLPPRIGQLFPPNAVITQRGVLTVRDRQFTMMGYIARSETNGLRLLMTETFGGVLADVMIEPDGKVIVVQAKPPFRPAWAEKYVAADLRCVFGRASIEDCPGWVLSPTHFVIKRPRYTLDLQTVEVKTNVPPSSVFDPNVAKQK